MGASLRGVNEACPLERAEGMEGVCVVCLEDMEAGQRVRRLPCGHVFHDPCAVVWLVKRNCCPVCRSKPVDGEEEFLPGVLWEEGEVRGGDSVNRDEAREVGVLVGYVSEGEDG